MGNCSGQPPPFFFSPPFFQLFSLVSDRFMIVLRKNVEKKSVPIRPCALGHFKVLQLWSNLQSFTGVLKVTIRGYTPMYDTSFFTIFQDHHLLIIPCMHNFGPIDLKFWEQICNTICHNLRGDNYLKLAADRTILVQLTRNFGSKFWIPFVIT